MDKVNLARSKLLKRRKQRREKQEQPSLISDGLTYHVDNGDSRHATNSLVPYRVQQPIVPEKTQQLVKWLKRPRVERAEPVAQFVPDPMADADLRKAQQTAMEIQITRLFEGTKRLAKESTADPPTDLLSPFTQYFLRDREMREDEKMVRRTLDALEFEMIASTEKKCSLDEKRNLVQDYVKWIERQIQISSAVREQTASRTNRDRRCCEQAAQNRTEAFEEQAVMMDERLELRQAFRARKKWRIFMEKFQQQLGESFHDIADFCGFYEMSLAVLKLCMEMQDAERLQLDTAQRKAEIRPEYENFLIVTGRVQDKLTKLLGPKLDYDDIFCEPLPDQTLPGKLTAPPCDMQLLPRC